ncbi:C45 family autoproteolytic acyltransferase/hydolase [Parahaliea mediterranea]|uniref:Linear amide C-N hydrolase n=1 Tax=Parahaliea mediterranea TaxID=651086 RepID=A0A939IN40_9GAMM|nr:C45 family peptidase [Parahaliea mediterranea]MBN7797657.1 linear amide C-N hydrolase [Parahaliea mediterranea]
MYHPRLYGDFYDMGRKYGELLYKKAGFVLPAISREKRDFGLASFEILREHYPDVVREIEGFAEGINDTPDNLAAFLLSIGIFDTSGQCSVFAYRNTGNVIIGRNYDMLFAFKKFTESSLVAPQNRYSYIGQSDVFIGKVDGINETGLSIAMSFVNGTSTQPGVGFHMVIRNVLENCSTTAQAIKLIRETPVATANNFLVADQSGDLAVIESAPEKSHVRRPAPGEDFIYITNQFVSTDMKPHDKGGTEWSKNTERATTLKDSLSALSSMDLNSAREILSNKCVCLDLKKEGFGTIWSVVADLNALTIERAETKPKRTNYKPETRLDWWLRKKSA